MAKKKIKPEPIHTREGLDSAVADYVRASLRHAGLLVKAEEEKAAIDRKHAEELSELGRLVDARYDSVLNYCLLHRPELLPDEKRKSFETNTATVGFADNPPALDKSSGETFEAIARRLLGLTFNAGQPTEIACAAFVNEKPALDREALKAAIEAGVFTPDQLKVLGLCVRQEERFYITPKSELLETESKAVA